MTESMAYVLILSWPIIGVFSQIVCVIVRKKWRNPAAATVAIAGGILVGWIGLIAMCDVLELRKS